MDDVQDQGDVDRIARMHDLERDGVDSTAWNETPGVVWRGVECVDSGDWPRWRWMRATAQLPKGHAACESEAFAVVVIEEWKRRVCAHCFAVCNARLTVRCERCAECYYCDAACREQHGGEHSAVCPALGRFSGLKKVGKESMAVFRLLLHALARVAGGASASGELAAHAATPGDDCATMAAPIASFDALQHHPPSFDSAKSAHDWAKAAALFRGVLEPCPALSAACSPSRESALQSPSAALTDEALYSLISRIDSNVFGVFNQENCGEGPRVAMGRRQPPS